jgi:ABC-type branched-subunit amino acid transport system substrate-binding protein
MSSSMSSSSGGGSGSVAGVNSTSITFGIPRPVTGPAAASSEIASASQAYFDYVNAHAGVFGRKIHLRYKAGAYNPTDAVGAVRQLVEQDHVFAIFEGLGTPAPTRVVSYLNSEKVPDLFVASGCGCWDSGSSQPFTFGWQPQHTIEGKILGQYVAQHFPGQKVGVLYQNDFLGRGGLAGIEDEIPRADIVSKQAYRPGVATLEPQVAALKAAGAKVLVDFTLPFYTALGQLASFKLGYKPQLVVSNAGSDPTTVGALLKSASKGKASRTSPIEGALTDGYLPSPTAMTNPWIRLFRKVRAEYDPGAPFDANVVYGMANAYTLVQALTAVGKNLTRQALVDAINDHGSDWKGPGLVPFRYSTTDHGGFAGVQMGQIRGGKIVLFGNALRTDPSPRSPIRPYPTLTPPPPTSGMPTGSQITDG